MIGSKMAGGNSAQGRQEQDFYATPTAVTRGLFSIWFPGEVRVWEPACGNGMMSKVLEEKGFEVHSSDKNDHGFGKTGVDFLTTITAEAPCLITNPPFTLAEAFIVHAHDLDIHQMALVLKATYWHAAKRQKLWSLWTPALIAPLTWRPDFLNLGGPTMEIMWCVWDREHRGSPIYRPILHPAPLR